MLLKRLKVILLFILNQFLINNNNLCIINRKNRKNDLCLIRLRNIIVNKDNLS